ncbi:MAG: hypothetical protein ACLGSA_12805 [Acidobacteriota bacterium]
MFTIRNGLVLSFLVLCLLSSPVAAYSASSAGHMPFSDSAKADARKMSENKAKYDGMNKGADLMLEGSDMMAKKDKQAMIDGQKMMVKGDRMMRSSGAKDKGSLKMLHGADMMLKAAELIMNGSDPGEKSIEKMMSDGKYILLEGKGMMMDSFK